MYEDVVCMSKAKRENFHSLFVFSPQQQRSESEFSIYFAVLTLLSIIGIFPISNAFHGRSNCVCVRACARVYVHMIVQRRGNMWKIKEN